MDQIHLYIVCYNWLRQSIMVAKNEEMKERKKRKREEVKALTMAMKTVLKQPEKHEQRDLGEK